METFYSIVQKESEYRILLTPANLGSLSANVLKVLADRNIDVSELMIDRISGETTTEQDVLHDITGWVADLFANNPNLIIYYSCDDMTPIPSRNTNSDNKDLPYWKNFKKIVEIDPSGIQSSTMDRDNNSSIYDLNGRKLKEPSKGINIIGRKKM